MNIKYRYKPVTSALTGCIIIVILLTSSLQSVVAQQPASDHRTKAQIHNQLFQDGLENVRKDRNRLRTINALLDFTLDFNEKPENVHSTRRLNSKVVREIFSLAKDDSEIQQYLLNIIGNPSTSKYSHRTACELLVYVADDQAGIFMLNQLKQEWPSDRWGHYFNFFKDVGDIDFLQWLDETARKSKDFVLGKSLIDQYSKCIRMQQNNDDILEYMLSETTTFDRVWALNQAIRHGVDIELIRSKILTALQKESDLRKKLSMFRDLIRQCDELGIVRSEDAEDLSMIRRSINRRFVYRTGGGPKWAVVTIEAKRDKFYRFNRVKTENTTH